MNATIAVALLLLAGPKLELSVGAGGNSNPFELPDDQTAAGAESRPQPGAFVPVEASAEWKTPSRRMFRAGVDSWFDGQFFTFMAQDNAAPQKTDARDANRWTGEITAPLVFDPLPGRRRAFGVELTAEPFFGMHRETYTSHRTGTPFFFDDRPNDVQDVMVDLSRRYDTNEMGLGADADVEIGRMVDVVAGGRYTSVDYVEDYGGTEHLDSWDFEELRAEVDAFVRPGEWSFSAGYKWRVRNYDSRFPRDETGEKVEDEMPGYEPQVFTYHDLTLRGGYVAPGGRAVLRFRNTRRIDDFQGYQSYSENAVYGDFRIALQEDSELRFSPAYSVRTYDELRVSYDPQEPVSDRRRVSLDAGYEWPALSKWTRFFVSGGLVSQSSANPLYAYVEFHAMTGVRAQWR